MLTPEPRPAAPPRQVFPYPRGPLRTLLRAPLVLYRLGLGELLARVRLVVLTTRGRKSGLPRHTIVEYRMHGKKVYLISGWGNQPNWVQNLYAHPHATVQAGPRTYHVVATPVENTSEVLRALFLFRKPAPNIYDALLARMTDANEVNARILPALADQLTVLRLDIVDGDSGLPGAKADLAWTWGVAAVVMSVVGVLMWFARNRNGGQNDT